MMRKQLLFLAGVTLLLSGCGSSGRPPIQVLIGAELIDGTGRPPVRPSVVVIAGSRIRAVGDQQRTPVPAGSEKMDTRGMFIVPAFLDSTGQPVLPQADALPPGEAHEVIVAATREAAVRLNVEGETGTIEAGKFANLLLLSADPLQNSRNLAKVEKIMIRGQWFSPSELAER